MAKLLLALVVLSLLPAAAGADPEGAPFSQPGARGRIGLQVQPMTPELREHLGAPTERGVLVVRVGEDTPAADAGVRVGDVVVRAGRDAIDAPHDLIRSVARAPAGEPLALELVREGKTLTLEVRPAGEPAGEPWERWLPGGRHPGRDDLEQRLDEIERRLDEIERRLPDRKPT